MIDLRAAFASSYAQARTRFLEAAATSGLRLESLVHPLPGGEGEVLAMDLVLSGRPDAEALLLVSSGCHGVEGFCGSGVQVHALHDAEWLAHAQALDVAVLYIHGLNPFGFSHLRRATQENVDLNRNFHDFSAPLPANPAYGELHELLLPPRWPPGPDNTQALAGFIQTRGMARLQAAVSAGQHTHPDGLFFGGTSPTWSNLTLRDVLRRHGQRARRIGWIDLHTGLGPAGAGERILACRDDAAALQRARDWWGSNGATPITSFYDGSSVSARLTGLMCEAAYDECPQAEYTGIAIEYGTVPLSEALLALRAEQWLQRNPLAPEDQARAIKQQLRDAFYMDTDAWKGQVVSQARQALFQGASGLAGRATP